MRNRRLLHLGRTCPSGVQTPAKTSPKPLKCWRCASAPICAEAAFGDPRLSRGVRPAIRQRGGVLRLDRRRARPSDDCCTRSRPRSGAAATAVGRPGRWTSTSSRWGIPCAARRGGVSPLARPVPAGGRDPTPDSPDPAPSEVVRAGLRAWPRWRRSPPTGGIPCWAGPCARCWLRCPRTRCAGWSRSMRIPV
jgi:hypothetical protein